MHDLAFYKDLLARWEEGRYLWAGIYYLSGVLVIALPAVVAADLLHERPRRIVALAAAIVAGIVTWVQPGARATAKKNAYNCLMTALAEDVKSAGFQQQFAKCVALGNYEYVELTPERAPAASKAPQ